MQDDKIFFPHDIYEKYLALIEGINFTPREIDVIACLINARGTNKIASLLSISPNTVLTYVRNIISKLGCNSREGIVDFIERSHKLPLVKTYYAKLVIHVAFEKSLKEISKLNKQQRQVCLILYGENQTYKKALIHPLLSHLKQVGIRAEVQEEGVNHVLLLLLEKKDHDKIPKGFDYVNLSEPRNYYFSIFEILKKLLPEVNFENVSANFIKQYKGLASSSESKFSEENKGKNKIETLQKTIRFLKINKWYFLIAIFFIGLFYLSFRIVKETQPPSHQEQKEPSIRSDLGILTESAFLPRPRLIAQIDGKFKDQPGIQSVAIVGPGGAGKTTIARQYARLQKADVIWEINSETYESLQTSFESLAQAFAKTEEDQRILRDIQDVKDSTKREEKIIPFVRERLKFYSNWVLLFDNVEKFAEIQKYYPQDPDLWG